MRLFLPLLLMLMVLASQSICAVHMHIGMHSAQLGGHGGAPHFHADAGHAHSHSHGVLSANGDNSGRETSGVHQPGIEEIPDQDVGVYYVSDSVSRDIGRLAQERLADLLLFTSVGHERWMLSLGSCLIPNADGRWHCCLSGGARIPLFLRDASIRC